MKKNSIFALLKIGKKSARQLALSLKMSSGHFLTLSSGCSVARLSRRVWDAEVAGSNPATPTLNKSLAFAGLLFLILLENFP